MAGLRRALHLGPDFDPDTTAVRRVAVRLATLTVGLILGLLVSIIVAVYVTAHALMLGSLQDLLRAGAQHQVSHLKEALQAKQEDGSLEAPELEGETSGVAISFASESLTFLGSSTAQFRTSLPDRVAAADAIRQDTARFSQTHVGADNYLVYTLPVRDAGRVFGVVQAAASTRQYDQGMRDLLKVLIAVGALGLLASAAISTLVVRRALVPIRSSMRRQRDFVADAAHELRTPLTILHSAVEIGLAGQDPGEQEDALSQALVESRHLARLIDDLSLLARADSGALLLEMQPVNLEQLVAETVSGIEMLAEDRQVRLNTTFGGIGMLWGDRGRLRQLLVILLDNALKHTPPGGDITVALTQEAARAHLLVRDTGSGIDPKDLPRVFDRLYRGGGERGTEGGGLGLAIGRWIVEAHGGTIAVANIVPHGAAFTVTLPVPNRLPKPDTQVTKR